eukprot:CAMPEP_0184644928 /NCGR_PEP_ID=MMETSP0308-20130426/1522_1 /TAXON_ID=38269 /ORGANISM="Gloeochaete witrockiana, Strain SAG 46.84" /LENGTH=380 /DNA_ID=CAMNT_0027073671 /DNA_START=31 /DNA_END=1173 /DNA_ORIENTATION=+
MPRGQIGQMLAAKFVTASPNVLSDISSREISVVSPALCLSRDRPPPAGALSTRFLGSQCNFRKRFSFMSTEKPVSIEASAAIGYAASRRVVPKLQNPEDLLQKIDTFVFDCDGVVWRGDEVVPGASETIDYLRKRGKRLIFVTNNSTKSRVQYLQKFLDLGIKVNEEEMFSSSFAAAAYLQSIHFKKKVYLVGEVGIEKELDLAGIKHFGGPADGDKKIVLQGNNKMEVDPEVGAVVVGFDRYFNYFKIQYAVQCLRDIPGCMFIATNQDAVTHLTAAQEWAGAGSMVGAIRASSGVEPVLVGKPAPFMLNWIQERFGIEPEQICMVGDRLDTDILFGKDGGLTTMLVLSGVTSEQYLLSPENKIVPDFYADSIAALASE